MFREGGRKMCRRASKHCQDGRKTNLTRLQNLEYSPLFLGIKVMFLRIKPMFLGIKDYIPRFGGRLANFA
mgnify:CR=1 FL=1